MKLTPKKSAALPSTPLKEKPAQAAAKCGNAEIAPSCSPIGPRNITLTVSTKMH